MLSIPRRALVEWNFASCTICMLSFRTWKAQAGLSSQTLSMTSCSRSRSP